MKYKLIYRFFTLIFLVNFLITGCTARTSITRTGSHNYSPLPEWEEVSIFINETEVDKPFEKLGIIYYENPGKYQILTLGDAIPELKNMARAIGANGIIIENSYPVKSGIISTGIHVNAIAIRIFE